MKEDTKCCDKCLKCPDYPKHNYCHISDCPCHTDKSDTNTLREEFYTKCPEVEFLHSIPVEIPRKYKKEIADFFINKFNQKLEEIEKSLEKKLKIAIKRKNEIENDPLHPARCQYLGQEDAFKFALQVIKNKKI